MNFADKAWVNYEGKPLIRHVLNRIEPQVADIIVSRNSTDPRYDELPFDCVRDMTPPGMEPRYAGPLAGVRACSARLRTPFALIVPCDTPHLPTDLVEQFHEAIDDHDLVIAADSVRDQQLVFLARTPCLDSIDDYLASGNRSVHGWLNGLQYNRYRFSGAETFLNVNEPAQLR